MNNNWPVCRIHGIAVITFIFVFFQILVSCSSTRKAATLAWCDFRIHSVEKIELAGIRFQDVQSLSDIGLSDAATLMSAIGDPAFPLTLQLNIEGRNPNSYPAGLEKMHWQLFIDDTEITVGTLDQPIMIPSGGTAIIPVQVGVDLKKALAGKSGDAILRFCLNLAGMNREPVRFKVRMKPTIKIAGIELKYPGYININTTFGNQIPSP